MLNIRRVSHLLEALSIDALQLEEIVESPASFYEELLLCDPHNPEKKAREVVNVKGLMRAVQTRMYRRVLLPKLQPSTFSHGGVRGRSIKTNAQPHVNSVFALTADISNFYPSVHHSRVYRLFANELGCSPDVARICTKIATYRHHLALGLITSPILADHILSRADRRIGGACAKHGLIYTRFVDDITVSAHFDIAVSGFPKLIARILAEDGFKLNLAKQKAGLLDDGLTVTKLRTVKGHLDVGREYFDELIRQLNDAASLARDENFDGPYYTASQILGRVRFISWVNPGRRHDLIRRYRSIRWGLVRKHAIERKYQKSMKLLTRITAPKAAGGATAAPPIS